MTVALVQAAAGAYNLAMIDDEKLAKDELSADRAETRQLAKWGTGLFAAGIGGAILACGEFKKAGIDPGIFDWLPLFLGLANAWLQIVVNLRSRRVRRDLFPNASEELNRKFKKRIPGSLGLFFVLFPLLAGAAGTIGLKQLDLPVSICPHCGKDLAK